MATGPNELAVRKRDDYLEYEKSGKLTEKQLAEQTRKKAL